MLVLHSLGIMIEEEKVRGRRFGKQRKVWQYCLLTLIQDQWCSAIKFLLLVKMCGLSYIWNHALSKCGFYVCRFFVVSVPVFQTEQQLDCALDLMRRLPPQQIEKNLSDLIDLVSYRFYVFTLSRFLQTHAHIMLNWDLRRAHAPVLMHVKQIQISYFNLSI